MFKKFFYVLVEDLFDLPPVSLTSVGGVPEAANISANFRKQFRNWPNGILWGWGETDLWKRPEVESLVTLSL